MIVDPIMPSMMRGTLGLETPAEIMDAGAFVLSMRT